MIRKTLKSDYFSDTAVMKSRWRGAWVDTKKVKYKVVRVLNKTRNLLRISSSQEDGFVGRRAERKIFKHYQTYYFALAHAPYPIDRDFMLGALNDPDLIRQNIQHRFRSKQQFWPMAYLAHLGFDTSKSIVGPDDWAYISCARHSRDDIIKVISHCVADKSIVSLCVQSLDMATGEVRERIFDYLEDCLAG
jgi:hypothetical protein